MLLNPVFSIAAALLFFLTLLPASGQQTPILHGRVVDAQNTPVSGALVRLTDRQGAIQATTSTSANGSFRFDSIQPGTYRLAAQKGELRSESVSIAAPEFAGSGGVTLPLALQKSAGMPAMQFSDQPSFAIAGVTDWTAVGGHGSDAILRTGEALARSTLTLKPLDSANSAPSIDPVQAAAAERRLRSALASSPASFQANHELGELYLRTGRYRESLPLLESASRLNPKDPSNTWDLVLACRGVGDLHQARAHLSALLARSNNADWLRLAGDLDEQLDNPLAAVRDYQKALDLDPSEQNYFALGSELLLHRAIWQSQEVFRKGVQAWPHSVRMLTAFGAALFAGALYDQAALHLCTASDLAPADREPYLFMGRIDIASPDPLPCIEQKLARFARQNPQDAAADYLYAMALLKAQERAPNPQSVEKAKTLLQRAVQTNPQDGNAWLELGNLAASKRDYPAAISLYRKAIDADPQLGDAYYRLGVAYDHTGNLARAQQEFRLHDQITRQQTEAVDRQRRSIQQFLFAKDGTPITPDAKQP